MVQISNPLVTPEQLYQRSSFSSLPSDLQDVAFYTTQCLTQAAGVLLQLPQSTTAQANVILARYWLVEPPKPAVFSDVSAASIFVVSKLGPRPRSPRDIANVYAYLLSSSSSFLRPKRPQQPPDNDTLSYYLSESEYFAFHSRVLTFEARILYALSFDTHVALPHPLAVTYLQALDFLGQPKEAISKRTVEYLNTALLSPQLLYLTHQPNMLAVAAIYNAAKDVKAKMPECEWWEVFDVDREELGFLVVAMRSLEGWVTKQLELLPWLRDCGMFTGDMIETEMRKRGMHVGNDSREEEDLRRHSREK